MTRHDSMGVWLERSYVSSAAIHLTASECEYQSLSVNLSWAVLHSMRNELLYASSMNNI